MANLSFDEIWNTCKALVFSLLVFSAIAGFSLTLALGIPAVSSHNPRYDFYCVPTNVTIKDASDLLTEPYFEIIWQLDPEYLVADPIDPPPQQAVVRLPVLRYVDSVPILTTLEFVKELATVVPATADNKCSPVRHSEGSWEWRGPAPAPNHFDPGDLFTLLVLISLAAFFCTVYVMMLDADIRHTTRRLLRYALLTRQEEPMAQE